MDYGEREGRNAGDAACAGVARLGLRSETKFDDPRVADSRTQAIPRLPHGDDQQT